MDQAVLDEIVRRIVAVAQPERIILFGSAARGEMGPGSDVDLLVIKSDVSSRLRLAQQIERRLYGVPIGTDIIVVTPEDVRKHGHKVGTIIGPALREGREINAA